MSAAVVTPCTPAGASAITTSKRALVIERDEEKRRHLEKLLSDHGYAVAACGRVDAALKELAARSYQCVFSELARAEELLAALNAITPRPIVLVTTTDVQAGLQAVDRGAFDCLTTPVEPWNLSLALRRVAILDSVRREHRPVGPGAAKETPGSSSDLPTMCGMVGTSRAMREVFATIEKVAQHKTGVLIMGESGTGKELVARAIHDLGPRRGGQFVAINCGAIPANLLESELFGYRRGAFTDAVKDKPGLFEVADGGTLFLDEIGELPLNLQVKLLRAIQEEEIRRIGDSATSRVDVRIIAATLRDLSRDVAEGRFREDLFYRINVVPVEVPPLRARPDDIPLLVDHFIRKYAEKHKNNVERVTDEAMALLRDYSWPGNIRELENTIERAMILCDGPSLDAALFADKLGRRAETPEPLSLGLDPTELSIKKTTRRIEETLIRKALEATRGNRTNAAKLLEISHRALLYKIREYGI